MRIPKSPPPAHELVGNDDINQFVEFSTSAVGNEFVSEVNRKYLHWDKFRFYERPKGVSEKVAWAVVKTTRASQMKDVGIDLGTGSPSYWIPPHHAEWLHYVDKYAGGSITSLADVASDKEKYLINSLMEEAIASSQLEGATTTRVEAKRMLRTQRTPKDRAEQMIVNNYNAIMEIRELKDEPFTPALVRNIQEIITEKTLDDESAAGRFRTTDDPPVVVGDNYGNVIFTPPEPYLVEDYVSNICEFANEKPDTFIHPAVKAIAIHFAIGFTHPFLDGNGRTARALFYWHMLREGYWLFEYLPISRIFLNAPAKYARAYLYTETDGNDLTYFSDYHLSVIVRAIEELRTYLTKQASDMLEAKSLLDGWTDKLNHRQIALLHDAIKHPGKNYTIKHHAGTHHVTNATARSDLFELQRQYHLLKVVKEGRKWVFTPEPRMLKKLKPKS